MPDLTNEQCVDYMIQQFRKHGVLTRKQFVNRVYRRGCCHNTIQGIMESDTGLKVERVIRHRKGDLDKFRIPTETVMQ